VVEKYFMPCLKRKFVKALDDWYPSYKEEEVQVTLHDDLNGKYRIAVWGEDDYGMEKEYSSLHEASDIFDFLVLVSTSILKNIGFVRA
jgi:hypothetical protein